MVTFKVKVVCDNGKCPDEATAEATIELNPHPHIQEFTGVAAELCAIDSLQLPFGWSRDVYGKTYCSERCRQATP